MQSEASTFRLSSNKNQQQIASSRAQLKINRSDDPRSPSRILTCLKIISCLFMKQIQA